jgi:hypothetical protein
MSATLSAAQARRAQSAGDASDARRAASTAIISGLHFGHGGAANRHFHPDIREPSHFFPVHVASHHCGGGDSFGRAE